MKKFDKERVLLAVAGPVMALVAAILLTSVVLIASGKSPIEPYSLMLEQIGYSDVQVLIVNQASLYYIAALAVALGFRMNLFNIGVDGQYRLAAMMTAVVGAHVDLPAFLQVPMLLLVAVLTGGIWAGVAGVLKVTRGVSEVVATIMLNAIATSLIAYLTLPEVFGELVGDNKTTGIMNESGWVPGIDLGPDVGEIYGLVFLAVALGIVYWLVLNRTRFGFDLRATGESESAAAASGVDAKRMILTVMIVSGGVSGLAGLPLLLGDAHTYSLSSPRASASPPSASPCSAATTPAHRARRPPVGLPRQGVPRPRLRDSRAVREGDRDDHAGADRLRGRHLLRGRPHLGSAPPAEARR